MPGTGSKREASIDHCLAERDIFIVSFNAAISVISETKSVLVHLVKTMPQNT